MVKEQASQARHVLDRFHIVQKLGKAIDKVRAAEAKQLQAQGKEPVLKNSRWLLLKRPERLTEKQEPKLAELLKLNLRTVRAYLLKEDFQLLWDCRSPTQANKFLKRWCRRATRSRIQPMQKVAKMLRQHRPLVLNWFRGSDSSERSCRMTRIGHRLLRARRCWACRSPPRSSLGPSSRDRQRG